MKSMGVGEIVRVSVYAFIAWIVVLFLLSRSIDLARPVFIAVHYLVDVIVFGVVFSQYYRSYNRTEPFRTTIIAMISLLVYEAVFWVYFSSTDGSYLNYIDWILPLFLITTTVYWVGKFVK